MSGISQVNLNNTFGAVLIGVLIAAALWGIRVPQNLSSRRLTDNGAPVYVYLVSSFGDFPALGKIVWSLAIEVLVNGITALLVQWYENTIGSKGTDLFTIPASWFIGFSSVSSFTPSAYPPADPPQFREVTGLANGLSALVLGGFASILVYLIQVHTFDIHTFAELHAIKDASMAINILGAVSDLFLAATLCVLLHRSRSGIKNTDNLLNKLILFSVSTGLLTSLCALASLIAILAAPSTFIYIAFFFNIGRLYSNTMLAVLNARNSLRKDTAISTQGISLSNFGASSRVSQNARTERVTVHATREPDSDRGLYISDSKNAENDSLDMSGHESEA
ncbi:hypothetical protein HWV62_31487 [Athelia sp. TMB]|nr:hypothetical protein HWV62_31487 [Athelia sp. TMB]